MLLAYVYNEHGEALEWDMFHLWGIDINNVSIRRMNNFFTRLPPDSETMSDMKKIPREARFWDAQMYMLANIIDALQAVDWHIIASNTKHPPRPPKPFKRPELKAKPVAKKKWPGKTVYVGAKE